MFSLSFSELLLIFIIALIVIDPKKLPYYAKKSGQFVRKAKTSFERVKNEVYKGLESRNEDHD